MKGGSSSEPEKPDPESRDVVASPEKEKEKPAPKVGQVEVFDDTDVENDDFGFGDLSLNPVDVLVPIIPGNETGYDSNVFVLPKDEEEVAAKPSMKASANEKVCFHAFFLWGLKSLF